MKAVTMTGPGGPEVLIIGEVPLPVLKEGEVLVKVEATGLNRAETLQRRGMYPVPPGASEILGLECAGIIHQSSIEGYPEGQRVMALLSGGGYAQYAAVHHSHLMPIPDHLSFEEAAAVPEVWLTAFQITFTLGQAEAGHKIFVHAAASGVGTAVIQMAKLKGVQVCAVSRTADKLQRLRELGADIVCLAGEEAYEAVLSQWGGVDLVLDPIGAAVYADNLRILNIDGRVVHYGLMGGTSVPSVDLGLLLRKRATEIHTTLRSRTVEYKGQLVQQFVSSGMLDGFKSGELKPVVDTVDSWENVQQLHEAMDQNKNAGKLIMKISH